MSTTGERRMQINTKKVKGRRKVRYESLKEFLADAQRLATVEVRTLGNWSQGQIYEHLAQGLHVSIDGADFKLPAPLRWIMSLLMKKKFVERELPPGFKSSESQTPGETSTADGLASLQKGVERLLKEPNRAFHPGFGNISRKEWDGFSLRHAEMHMSFIVEK